MIRSVTKSSEEVCRNKRKATRCEECCRYKECKDKKMPNWSKESVIKCWGSIIDVKLSCLFVKDKINSINKRRLPPKVATEKKEIILWERGRAISFFKSEVFKLLELDLDWLIKHYREVNDIKEKIDMSVFEVKYATKPNLKPKDTDTLALEGKKSEEDEEIKNIKNIKDIKLLKTAKTRKEQLSKFRRLGKAHGSKR